MYTQEQDTALSTGDSGYAVSKYTCIFVSLQEQGEQVKRLVAAAPRQESEITGFKSDLTKKTMSLSAVWEKFSSRLREREKALRRAVTFYDGVSKVHTCIYIHIIFMIDCCTKSVRLL